MDDALPMEIAPDEVIVRAIKTPFHIDLKKQPPRLKSQAFRPAPGRDDLSVMRKLHLGNDGCKRKALEIAKDAYVGLAALRAQEIVDAKAKVRDSREGQFLGHAEIELGMPAPATGQTAAPELMERWQALAEKARFYRDAQPDSPEWTGHDII
jgi:hypothetical protein